MKNVNGLANAMRLVESACDKGEITIIGEGGVPTPVELYKKCVAYINAQYGVDILNLVLNEQKPCECNGSCETEVVDEDEDEDEILYINSEIVGQIVNDILEDTLSCLSYHRHGNIVDEIVDYYCDMSGECADDYDAERVAEEIYEILANNLELSDYDEDIINEMIEDIVDKVYEDGITIQ